MKLLTYAPLRCPERWLGGLVAAVLCLSCGELSNPSDTQPGELGNGNFIYRCLKTFRSDAACLDGLEAQFPAAIAVGGAFEMEYQADSDSDVQEGMLAVRPSSTELLVRSGDRFTAVAPGITALLALAGDSSVADIKHVKVVQTSTLDIVESLSVPLDTVYLQVGDDRLIHVVPRDVQGNWLAGSLSYTWTSEDPTIARFESAATQASVRVDGLAEGQTTLTVSLGEVTHQIPIVVESQTDTSDTTDSDSDSDSDSDTTDSDTTSESDTEATDSDSDTDSDTDTDTDTDTGFIGGGA